MESGQKSLAQLALEQKTPKYVTLEAGSKISGYTPDFLDRLCRLKKVKYRLWNGNKHVIELESLLNETHSIIPSFEGLDLIDESDTTPDTSVAAISPLAEKEAEMPSSNLDGTVSSSVPPPVEENVSSVVRPQDLAAPVSIPIESKPMGGTIMTESRPIGVERAKAMLGYAAASSRKRVGESRIGEFSFVGRSVISDPDHPENSVDGPDARIPIPIMAAEMEVKRREAEEGVNRSAPNPSSPAVPPVPEPAAPLPAPEPWVPPTPSLPPQPAAPSVVATVASGPIQQADSSVPAQDDWDALLLGGQPPTEATQVASEADIGITESAAAPVATPTLPVAPALATPPLESVPPAPPPDVPAANVPLVPTSVPTEVSPNTHTEALPPRADLGDILSAMMPPGVIAEEGDAIPAQPQAVIEPPASVPSGAEVAESDKPLFPPLSRPQPLSVEPLEMFPKAAMVAPTPTPPARPPFPELSPLPGNTLGTQTSQSSQVRPPVTPPSSPEPSLLDDHMLARNPVFNTVAALVLLLAALGLALAGGHVSQSTGQTASVGSAFSEDGGVSSIEAHDPESAIRDAFSDDVIVTPGATENSVIITPIFQSGPGNSFEYILMPDRE